MVDQSKGFLKRDYAAERTFTKISDSKKVSPGNNGGLTVKKKKSTPIRRDKSYPSNIRISEVDLSSLNKRVNEQKQNRHVRGTREYEKYKEELRKADSKYKEPSYIDIVLDEVQSLVNIYSGTGILMGDLDGVWSDEEMILDNDVQVGYAVLEDGTHEATSYFKIHYSGTGTHIVPMSKERGIKALKKRRYNK